MYAQVAINGIIAQRGNKEIDFLWCHAEVAINGIINKKKYNI